MKKIRTNACIDLTRALLETVAKVRGLSVSEALVGLSVAGKLMKKGTADIYQESPSVSDEDIEETAETLYEVLILSGRKPQN